MDYNLDSIYENIYEYYINDYIIFEGILRRDYMECIGILNEDGNKNFLKNIWDKIIEALKKFKEKIKEVFAKIKDKMLYDNEKKLNTIWRKYYKYYDKENGELNKFTINNFKPFNLIDKILDIDKLFDIDNNGKDYIDKIYHNFSDKDIEELTNKINNIDKLKEDIHNKIWINKEIKYPFKEINGLKEYIEDKPLYTLKSFKEFLEKREKGYNDYINRKMKKIENEIKEWEKNKEEDKGIAKELDERMIKLYSNNLKGVSLLEHLLFNQVRIVSYEFNNLFRESIKLYIAAGKYLKNNIIV